MYNFIALVIVISIAAILDLKYRKVPVLLWVPAICVIIPNLVMYYTQLPLDLAIPQFIISVFFAGCSFALVFLKKMGGADGILLACIAFSFPVNPLTGAFQPIWLYTIVLASVVVILWSCLNYFKNLSNKKRGTFEQMAFSSLIPSEQIRNVKGWITTDSGEQKYIEDLSDDELKTFLTGEPRWIVISMPFIIPIFVGLVVAVLLG